MFSLFTQPVKVVPPTYFLRDFVETAKAIATLKAYYKGSAYRVSNNHILVKLINALMGEYTDSAIFDRAIKANAADIGILGINTQYRVGQLLDDPFVGGLNKCMIYLDEYSNSSHRPATVVYHPFTQVSLPFLNGTMILPDLGTQAHNSYVSTYSISLRGLMYGYRAYLLESGHSDPAHYVCTRVLPRMFTTFYYLSLWNRLWYPLANKEIVDAPNRHRLKTLNLMHSNIPAHNTYKALKTANIVAYQDLLEWQLHRGYSTSVLGKLPRGVNIYRPTAAYAWFSRGDMINGLLVLGKKELFNRQGEYIRELIYQYNLTVKGNFIMDQEQRLRVQSTFVQLTDTIKSLGGRL